MTALAINSGLSIGTAILAALLIGGLVGLINGLVVTRLRVNPLIATLGMMSIARSITLVISGGYPLANLPDKFTIIGQGYIVGIPISFIIMFILAAIGDIMLRKSIYLRNVYYIGGNEEAAKYSGINTKQIKVLTYVMVGVLAALAGIISTSRLGSASPQAGLGIELRVISACVIGGASLNGGEGTILGSILGVILVNFINNGMVLLNISVYWQGLVSGLILVAAVALDAARRID